MVSTQLETRQITFLNYIQAIAGLVTYPTCCGRVICLNKWKLCDSVSVAMRIRSSSGGANTGCDGCLTAGQLLNDDLSENPELSDNCYQEYIMLGRVSNGPMLAATSRRIVYIRILFWHTEVYYSQYYHIISR